MADDEVAPVAGLAATPGGGWVPVPDPTTLTTLQLRRELAGQRELLEQRIDALKELTDQRLIAAGDAVVAALAAAKEAVAKAEVAADKRFESVNEFRGQAADQAARFLTRTEYNGAHTALVDSVNGLRAQIADLSAQVVPRLETDAWRQAMTDKFETSTGRNAEEIRILAQRLDLGQGAMTGSAEQRSERRLDVGTVLQVLAIVATAIGLVIVAFHK